MFLHILNNNRKKILYIFLFFAFAISFIIFAYNLKISSADVGCYHECNLTDPNYCVDNKVYECQSNCDADIYQDFCEIEDCTLNDAICVDGACVGGCAPDCTTVGEVSCANDGVTILTCGENDGDDCLDWVPGQNCAWPGTFP